MAKADDRTARDVFDRGTPTVLEHGVTLGELRRRLRLWMRDPSTGKLGRHHPADPAPIVLSGPGIGKSEMLGDLAREFEGDFVDIRLASTPLIELMGLQSVDHARGRTVWNRSDLLPPADGGRGGILLIDELTTSIPALQTEAYQILRERRVGPHRIPDNWFVIAAGNRINDRGVYYQMPDPLVNRCWFFELVPDLDDWLTWNMAHGHVAPEVHAFLRHAPQELYCRPLESRGAPFATPRSWTFASRTLQRWGACCPTDRANALAEARIEVEGQLGSAMATNFYAYLRFFRELPDIEAIMRGAIDPAPPAEHKADLLYAILGGLVGYVPTVADLTPFLRYLLKLPPSYAVVGVIDALRHRGDVAARLEASPAWDAYATKYHTAITAWRTTAVAAAA